MNKYLHYLKLQNLGLKYNHLKNLTYSYIIININGCYFVCFYGYVSQNMYFEFYTRKIRKM